MTRGRIVGRITCGLWSVLFFAGPALAQGDPALEQGIRPFDVYSGGDLDSVSLTTTKLNVHIPIWSYPQRGGKLHLNYSISGDSPSFSESCRGENCHWWPTGGGAGLMNDVMPYLGGTDLYDSHGGYLGTPWTVSVPGVSTHLMGAIPTSGQPTHQLRALDATGYRGDISNWAHPILYDADGTQYDRINGTVRDTNGNQIALTGPPGYPPTVTDTIGRIIPPIPTYPLSDSGDGHFAGCSAGADKEKDWNVPGQTGTVTIKLCWNSQTGTSDIVLPNLTAYTFKTNGFQFTWGDGTGYVTDLTEIDLPTGGKISYTWDWRTSTCNNVIYRVVTSRTVYDGHGNYTWRYAWDRYYHQLTVTDPANNQTVYVVSLLVSPCSTAVTAAQQYDSHQTLLRTVSTTYSWTADPGPGQGGALSLVPTAVKTTWPSNLQSQTTSSYGARFTFVDYANKYNGSRGTQASAYFVANLTSVADSDYGNGLPGSSLRAKAVDYAAFPGGDGSCSNAYCQKNLLNLRNYVDITGPGNEGYTTYTCDPATGNMTAIDRWPAGRHGRPIETDMTYSANGMLHAVWDALSHQTSFNYDATGLFLSSVTNAKQQSTLYNYNAPTGVLNSTTDFNGKTTSYTYDSMNRLLLVSYPDGGSSSYTYHDAPLSTSVAVQEAITSSLAKVTTALLDGLGQVQQTQLNSDPEGADYIDIVYDGFGRRTAVSNPRRLGSLPTDGTTQYRYDPLGRRQTVIEPDGGTIAYSYVDNQTTVTDEAGTARKTQVDPLGRLTAVWEDPGASPHLNYETDYGYDCLGNLVNATQKGGTTDPNQWRTRSFGYDGASRLMSTTNPENGPLTYMYDAADALVSRLDGRGITTTYSRDELSRLTGKTYSNGDPAVRYCYDNVQGACGVGAVTNGIGRRTGMADSSGATSWSYDAMGRVAREGQNITGFQAATWYYYNLDSGLSALIYPDGTEAIYTYSNAGRPVAAGWYDFGWQVNYAMNATYIPAGVISGYTNDAGITVGNSFNKRLQPTTLAASAGASSIFRLDYDFHLGAGDNGSVYGIGNPLNPARSQVYTYDSLDRLLTAGTVSCNSQTAWGDSYVVDAWGNLIQKNVSRCPTGEYMQFTADAHNRLNGLSYRYDADGNLTDDCCNHNVFDAENRWLSTPFNGGSTWLYDGDGRKVQRTGPSGTVRYWRDQKGNVLAETKTGAPDDFLYFGSIRMGWVAQESYPYYFYNDHLGTPRVITDRSGRPCYDADFYPYGGEQHLFTNTCANKQNYKFTGVERDPGTGTDYFGARWTNSYMSRFYSPDWSATPEPVPYAKLENPQSLNLYSYVRNNPTGSVDVDGHVYDDPTGGQDDLLPGSPPPKTVWAPFPDEPEAYYWQRPTSSLLPGSVSVTVNWPTNQSATRPNCFFHYGYYGGPCYMGGQWMPYEDLSPEQQANLPPPIDDRDACYQQHDFCYSDARVATHMTSKDSPRPFGKENLDLRTAQCDYNLSACLDRLGYKGEAAWFFFQGSTKGWPEW